MLMVNVCALTPATRTARATRGAENDFMAGAGRKATSVPVGSETEGTGRKVGGSAGGGLYRDGFGRCLFGPRARPSRGRWRGAGSGLPTGCLDSSHRILSPRRRPTWHYRRPLLSSSHATLPAPRAHPLPVPDPSATTTPLVALSIFLDLDALATTVPFTAPSLGGSAVTRQTR